MNDLKDKNRIKLQDGGDTSNKSYDEIVADIIAGYPEGDTQTIQRPSPYIEALQSAFGPYLANFLGTQINAAGGTNMFGQQYGSFLPQVAAQDQASKDAYQMAIRQAMGGAGSGRPEGVAGFQPYLDRATQLSRDAAAAAQAGQGAIYLQRRKLGKEQERLILQQQEDYLEVKVLMNLCHRINKKLLMRPWHNYKKK